MNKNTAPACGVADYEQTWEQFYDAANLRATYSFMQGGGAGYEGAMYQGAGYQGFTGRAGLGSAALQEIQPPANWSRAQDWSPVSLDRDYSASQGNITVLRKNIWKPIKNISPAPSSSSVLDQLTVSTLPAVMEYRVCDMLLALR